MGRLVASVCVFTLAATPLAAQSKKFPLEAMLEADLARFSAKTGLYVKHLTTGEEVALRADDDFNSYSVIKLAILARAYELADQKKLNLDERYELRQTDFRGGSGVFRHHSPGLDPTIRDLLTEMVITSDNTATDILLAKVGGITPLNEWLVSKGYARTKMVQSIFDFFRRPYELRDPKNKTLTPEELLKLQTTNPLVETREERIRREDDRNNWLGVMTPKETGRMLEAMERGVMVSKPASAEMKAMLLAQQAGTRRIPHFVTVPVAHKTGDGPPIIANDVGIVYARSGPIVISFFTTNNRELYADLEDRMGRTARLIVDYFDGYVEDRR
jgi:beta-lactamase class A